MTLGNYYGKSEVTTAALIDTSQGVFEARLSEYETPQMSGMTNDLQLSKLSLEQNFSHIDSRLSQQDASLLTVHGVDLSDQIGERVKDSTVYQRIERGYTAAWYALCAEFKDAISSQIESYQHLDEN